MNPRGQRKTQDPCEGCGLHRERCLCAMIPRLTLKTRISLIIHARELKRTTNTGTLAAKALVNSEVLIRGRKDDRLELAQLLSANYRPLLFFPSKDSAELSADFVAASPLPIHLIVPDGNWRQASKVQARHAELRDIPRVMLKIPNQETRHLRAETTPEGMATLQAIAHALGYIEGTEVRDQLLALYQLKLGRTLAGRSGGAL